MKNIILKVLRTGYTVSKKPLEEYIKYLYILKYIFREDSVGSACCNKNSFWDYKNIKNRTELISDIANIDRRSMADDYYYHIINRFENGDKYGIDVNY